MHEFLVPFTLNRGVLFFFFCFWDFLRILSIACGSENCFDNYPQDFQDIDALAYLVDNSLIDILLLKVILKGV